MRPGIDPAVIAAAAQPHIQLATLFEFDFPEDPAYLHAGWGRLVIGDKTYLGSGLLGRVGETRETIGGRVSGATYVLSGLEPELGAPIIRKLKSIKPNAVIDVRLLQALFDPVTGKIIGNPVLLREDQYDTAVRVHESGSVTLTITAEPPGLDRGVVGFARISPQSHKAIYPDDLGLDFQPQVGLKPTLLRR